MEKQNQPPRTMPGKGGQPSQGGQQAKSGQTMPPPAKGTPQPHTGNK